MYLTNQFAAVGYVSRTDQIVALGYVSRTDRIAAFGYLTPITAFGYCFLANDIIDEGAVHKEWRNQKLWAHLLSVMVCGLRKSLVD